MMQMKIMDNPKAMEFLFNLGEYVPEERAKLLGMKDEIKRLRVVNIRMIRILEELDALFYDFWDLQYNKELIHTRNEMSEHILNQINAFEKKLWAKIDRLFTEYSNLHVA